MRLWAGDQAGAEAMATPPPYPGSFAAWAAGEVALARGDDGAVGEAIEALHVDGLTPGERALGSALMARLRLHEGVENEAAQQAASGYRDAVDQGGLFLLAAAPVHAWCLARGGRWDEAGAVADGLRRRMGRQDVGASLHAALIHTARASVAGVTDEADRWRSVVADLRRLGFGPAEEEARRWLPGLRGASPGLEVACLGPLAVRVDGTPVALERWRSRKALAVLIALALAGPDGLGREELIERIWPDRPAAKGRALLRTALAEVRSVLEPSRPPGERSRFVTVAGDRVRAVATTDLARAQAHATAHQPEAAWACFRGAFLAGDADLDGVDEHRWQADALRASLAETLVADSSADPALRVEAVELLWQEQPWRTDVVEQVAADCRTAERPELAARVERLVR